MKRSIALLCVAFTVPVVFSAIADTADTNEIRFYELDARSPAYDSYSSVTLSWFIERYDFDWFESYIDYGIRYRYWERYLTSKQREIASKFGLSDIFVKPNFRRYEDTKLILSRRLWKDKLLLRYLAPAGDMGDFEISIALKPYRYTTFIAKNHVNGERSIAIVVNKSFGSESKNKRANWQIIRVLEKAKRLIKYK